MRPALARAVLAAALALAASAARAQQPEAGRTQAPAAVFPAAADIVLVDVVAADSRGEPVPDLLRDDFEVLDRGERRPILLFRPPEPSGRAIAFLIEDALARGWHVERARALVERAIARADASDRVLVIAPASRVATNATLPDGAGGLRSALGRVKAHAELADRATSPEARRALGQTRLSAVLAALQALRGQPGPRALVVIGPDFPYRAESGFGRDARESVVRASQRVAAPVYFLGWGAEGGPSGGLELRPSPATAMGALGGVQPMVPMELEAESAPAETAFDSVASDSGGFAARRPALWDWSLDRILARARAAYLLGIPSAPDSRDGGYHALEVRVARGGVRLYARKGYFAPSPEAVKPR